MTVCAVRTTSAKYNWSLLHGPARQQSLPQAAPSASGHWSPRHASKWPLQQLSTLPHLRAVAAGVQPALEHAVRIGAGVAALAGALHRPKERSSQRARSNFRREGQRQRSHAPTPPN